MLSGYGKIYHVGHKDATSAFAGPLVVIQEKIDGSQFSFGVREGQLFCRSRGGQLSLDTPDKLFALAIAKVLSIRDRLPEGRIYRAEAMRGPKHNLLGYERAPLGGMVLFDVDGCSPDEVRQIGAELGIEVVAELHRGDAKSAKAALENGGLMDAASMLGGPYIEGVVVKSYGPEGLVGRAKLVGEAFREVRKSSGGKTKGKAQFGMSDLINEIAADYATPARFEKARQYLEEAGKLTGERSDIGHIVRRIRVDIVDECMDELTARLWAELSGPILNAVAREVAPWFMRKELEAAGLAESASSPEPTLTTDDQ